jgi:DNA-binding NtrC family response regulator
LTKVFVSGILTVNSKLLLFLKLERKKVMPTILIIDDEPSMQGVLSYLLEEEGHYKVLQAETLTEAREVFDSHKSEIDAVLLDRIMDSGKTTDLLLNYIVKESKFSKPVIAFSGDDDSQKEQRRLGCSDQLKKNSSSDEILTFFKILFLK